MHSNDNATVQSLPRWWSGPAASTPSADVLTTHSHSWTVDPLVKDIAHAIVHQIQIWRIGWSHLWGDELWRFSLQQGEMFIFVGERHDFIDVNITSPGKGCTWHKKSKFTSIISIRLQSCIQKSWRSVRAYLYKKLSYRRKNAHLTSLYRMVQKTIQYVEPFRYGSRVWQTDRQTDRWTDGQTKAI